MGVGAGPGLAQAVKIKTAVSKKLQEISEGIRSIFGPKSNFRRKC